ncbi:NIN-like protein [Tanacetum coccineum]
MASKNISLEPPSVAFTGEARYLTPLCVFGTECELSKSATTEGVGLETPVYDDDGSVNNFTDTLFLLSGGVGASGEVVLGVKVVCVDGVVGELAGFGVCAASCGVGFNFWILVWQGGLRQNELNKIDKIKAALKLLALRKPDVLVQFWSPRVVGKQHQLTTIDQPFGFGICDERLISYRWDSECKIYDVDKDYDEEEDVSPLVRVFRKGLPEWSLDVTNYLPKHFPQQECAIRCNLHGYLALPVFDPTTRLRVGVIELLTSSMYTSFYYEVQQIQKALKKQDLTCLQISVSPAPNIYHEGRQNELNKIFDLLKVACDTHRLPLAQTWALSPSASVSSHEQVLVKSCKRYDTRCLGKVCMSTDALPFRVQDMGLWPFRDACKAQHLDMSRGLVGKALSYRGSCFCEDVTKLSEEEYPLVSHAGMSGLTSCFAIYLHSVRTNDGYVLEFFLPSRLEDTRYKLKQQVIEIYYGVDLDDNLPIQVIGPLTNPYETKEPYIMQTSSVNLSDECSSTNVSVTLTDAGEINSYLKQGRKRKRGSDDTMVLVTVTYGEDIKSFRFPISLGLLKLKKEVAKRFKLSKMICLKYTDEDDDLILICVDKDLEDAMVASGSKNSMNLICKPSAD